MLYICDLGNVIVDIDFNRVLGAWSDLTRIPLASLKKSCQMGEAFHQHERGEISDEAFAEALCHEMALPLSYEQFSHGWQAVFVALRPEVIAIMHKLREQGQRVVVLSVSRGNAWWCFPILTACILPSGRRNTRKSVMLLTISICLIDFNRVLGAWSDLTRVPLATLKKSFHMGEAFHQHERGEISDEAFAEALCHEMALPLSYEQFSHGWQAVFVALRPEVIAIMHKLSEQGHRVVVLSNTNRLHTTFWPEEYPEIRDAADHIYLSQDLGMRKPEARIYQHVLRAEGFSPDDTVFFDDNADNIEGANRLGITSILVKDKTTIPDYFAKVLC